MLTDDDLLRIETRAMHLLCIHVPDKLAAAVVQGDAKDVLELLKEIRLLRQLFSIEGQEETIGIRRFQIS